MKKITLKHPIQSPEGEISEISLRQVNGGDIIDIGRPYDVKGLEEKRIGEYISRLSGMLPSDVRKMMPSDYVRVADEVLSFFSDAEID